MKKISESFLILGLIVLLFNISSCSAETPEGFKKIMDTWIGHDINYLMSIWGVPSNEYTMPNGNKLYTYLWVGSTVTSVQYYYFLNQISADQVTWYCKKTVEVVNGKITRISWEGNACIAEDPY